MTRAYWDALADTYEEQIFSVFGNDHAGLIADQIGQHGDPAKTAADLGCGPGQITPLLARSFAEVHACDVSGRLLNRARRACAGLSNVGFYRHDLASAEEPEFAPVDFVLCINVLLAADLEVRERLWHRVTSLVAADGVLLLVVPSLESALYANYRRVDWHLRSGFTAGQALHHGLAQEGSVPQLEQGVRQIEGVATKHYLREEIIAQLADRSLVVENVAQLSYDWTTEFADPPEWLGAPFPWNWLVVARRHA